MQYGHRIYQHIEILGFSSHQITDYMESTLPQDKVGELKAYLKSHPQIRAGMYIPLNSAIVVTVYEESQNSGCAMPTTLTELYTSLTLTLLLRYLRGHTEYGADCVNLFEFKDMPPPVFAKFCELCNLAYGGTVGTKGQVQLVFKNLPSHFDDLGFMDSVTELYVAQGAVSSHNFLHLTFQEFFAAVHIVSMSPVQQLEHFKRHKEGNLKVVLRFLAGLNKLKCFSKAGSMTDFFQTPSTGECNYRCVISSDTAVDIDLIQWLFEAQSDDVIRHVLGKKIIQFDLSSGMLPLDYYSLGYCISNSQCQWVLRLGKDISKDEVSMLATGTDTGKKSSGKVVELKRKWKDHSNFQMKKPHLSLSGITLSMLFKAWKGLLCLHQLSLEMPSSCDCIEWPELSQLRVLNLEINGRKSRRLKSLLPRAHLSLQSFTITPGKLGGILAHADCVAIGNLITSGSSLKELCISSYKDFVIHIQSSKGMESITTALANKELPLERLDLECKCAVTASAVENLAQFITKSTTLKYRGLLLVLMHY